MQVKQVSNIPEIIIPRPVKKYSTDLSIFSKTEGSEDLELLSPVKVLIKKGSLKELFQGEQSFKEIHTRSCNPHSNDPKFIEMEKFQRCFDISLQDLELDL